MKKNSRLVKDNRGEMIDKILACRPDLKRVGIGIKSHIQHEKNHILNKANNIKYR